MTLAQAIKLSTRINVCATEIIDLDINKKQAHQLRKDHDFFPLETHGGLGVDIWSLNSGFLFLMISC